MKIEDLIGIIKNAINKKKSAIKKQEYVVKQEDLDQLVDEIVQKHIGEIEGERDKLVDEIQRFKEELKKEDQEAIDRDMQKAAEIEHNIKEQNKRKKKSIYFTKPPCQIVSAYDKMNFFKSPSGEEMKFWKGVSFELTNSGYTMFNLILSNGPKIAELPVGNIGNIGILFEWDTFLNDMKFGRVSVNITEDGVLLPPRVSYPEPEETEMNPNMVRMLSIDMNKLKDVDKEIRNAFISLYKLLGSAQARLEDSESKQRDMLTEMNETGMAYDLLSKDHEQKRSQLVSALDRINESNNTIASLKTSEMESRLASISSETIAQTQTQNLRKMQERMKEMSEDPRNLARLEFKEDIKIMNEWREAQDKVTKKE